MARIKFTALVESIQGTIAGTTFQRNAFGYTVKSKPNMVSPQSSGQATRKIFFQRALQGWVSLSPTERNNWNSYAGTFPTPSKNNPASYLSGFNLFVRWHSLAFEFQTGLMTNPNGAQGSVEFIEFQSNRALTDLICETDLVVSEGPWVQFLYLTRPIKSSQQFVKSWTRFMSDDGIVTGANDIYVQDQYFAKFGLLPDEGDSIGVDLTYLNTTNAQVVYVPSFASIVT